MNSRIILLRTFLLIMFFTYPVYSQSDSLISKLESVSGKEKVDLLNRISESYILVDKPMQLDYATRAYKLAEEVSYAAGQAKALLFIGRYYVSLRDQETAREKFRNGIDLLGDNDETRTAGRLYSRLGNTYYNTRDNEDAIFNMVKARQILEAVGDISGAGVAANNTGLTYWRSSRYDSALVHYGKAIQLRLQSGNKEHIGTTYNNIGVVFYHKGNYKRSLENYLLSLKYRKEIDDKPGIALVLNNIGKTYQEWDRTKESIEYYRQALKYSTEIGNHQTTAYTYNSMGTVFEAAADYDSALVYYDKSKASYELAGMDGGIILNLNNIGHIYTMQGKNEEAIKLLNIAYNLAQQSKTWERQAISLYYLGKAYFGKNDHETAFEYFEKCRTICVEIGQKDLLKDTYLAISEIHSARNNYHESLRYYKTYTALKDSLFSEESSNNINRLRIQYESEQKEQENTLLRSEKAAQEIIISRNNTILMLIGSLLIVVAGAAIILQKQNRQKKKANALLKTSNDKLIRSKEEIEQKHRELEKAVKEVRTLSDLLPICCSCKKIRDDDGYWSEVETYISKRLDTDFSHGICPDCLTKLYPDYSESKKLR